MSSLFKRPAATAQKRPAASTSSGRPSKKPAATWEVPPQAAAPVIHVMHNGKRHRLHGDCKNYSRVRQSVCKKFHLETVALEYEDDDGWVVFDDEVDKDGGLQARAKWSLRVCGEESAAEKIRVDGFCKVGSRSQVFKTVLARRNVSDFVRYLNEAFANEKALEDNQYCVPTPLQKTWGLDKWGETLNVSYNAMPGIDTDGRAERVLALISGSGFGKTHALLHAAEAWGKVTSTSPDTIYITYNLDQALHHDKSSQTEAAFLLRVALADSGFSNKSSGDILDQLPLTEIMEDISLEMVLIPLVAEMLERRLKADGMHDKKSLVLAVDECSKVEGDPARQVVSALGKLVNKLREKGLMVLALVSALTESSFQTWSNRPVKFIELPRPTTAEDMVDFVVAQQQQRRPLSAFSKETVCLMGGCHWRSTMLAVEMLGLQENQTVADLANRLAKGRFGTNITVTLLDRVREYILEEYKSGTSVRKTRMLSPEFANAAGMVPPIFAWMAFFEDPDSCGPPSPIRDFFSNKLGRDPAKQLEHCGIQFDRFKAQYHLPVFSQHVFIQVPETSTRTSDWYKNLFFSSDASGSVNRSSVFDADGTVVSIPNRFRLCHPELPNHRYIDRAAVAVNQATQEECLILYQDKLNADLSQAFLSLRIAARKIEAYLQEQKTQIVSILCVAQVVSYDRESTSLKNFPFPMVLIDKTSLCNVYRGTFAGAIQYQRQRLGAE